MGVNWGDNDQAQTCAHDQVPRVGGANIQGRRRAGSTVLCASRSTMQKRVYSCFEMRRPDTDA
jgi:hypothetical protein